MAEIIQFEDRKQKTRDQKIPVIRKLFNGEIVECIDFEMLSHSEQSRILTENTLAQALNE